MGYKLQSMAINHQWMAIFMWICSFKAWQNWGTQATCPGFCWSFSNAFFQYIHDQIRDFTDTIVPPFGDVPTISALCWALRGASEDAKSHPRPLRFGFIGVYPKRQHAWIHCGVNPSNSVVGFRCLGRSFKQQGGCRYLFLVPTTQGRWLSHPLVSYLGEHIPDRFQSLLANYINSCCNCDNDIGASPPQTAKLVYNSNNYGI